MATWKKVLVSGSTIDVAGLQIASTTVSSTAAELNLLDGSTAGSVVNSKAVVYGSAGEVNATTLQIGGTSITSTATELNVMDGGTSATSTTVVDADRVVLNDDGTMKQVAVTDLDTYFAQTTATLTNKTIGASQLSGTIDNARLDQQLRDIAGLAVTDGNIIVGDGTNFVAESGATARTSLGLGTSDNVQFAQITGSAGEFTGTVNANAFVGDGSGLTGVTGDFPTVHKTGESLDATKFSVNDGSGKFISGSQLLNYVSSSTYSGVSGDIAIDSQGRAAIQANSVALGTDTSGDYVASLTAGELIDLQNNSGETSSPTIDVDLTEATAATIANGDNIIFLDGGATGGHAKGDIADVATLFAGTGLTATNSVIAVDYGTTAGTALQGNTTVDDVSVSNLKTALAGDFSGAATIGVASDTITIAGDLIVQGTTTEIQTANLNVEDRFILLNSGSTSGDSGIIFGGTGDGTANSGHSIFVDDSNGDGSVFGFKQNLASNVTTGGTPDSKLGNIVEGTTDPTATPTFQGVGTIGINTTDEGIWIYS